MSAISKWNSNSQDHDWKKKKQYYIQRVLVIKLSVHRTEIALTYVNVYVSEYNFLLDKHAWMLTNSIVEY